MAVFAAGFALYALLLAWLTPAGSAACLAAAAAGFAAIAGAILRGRVERRRLMEEVERARAAAAGPQPLAASSTAPEDISGWLSEHPLVAVAVSALGGFLATRHPTLAGEIIAALRRAPR
jgi:hypothetical protein